MNKFGEYLGKTYEVKDLAAINEEGDKETVSGRFTVELYEPAEPDVGLLSDSVVIVAEGAPEDDTGLSCDPWELLEQIDPAYVAHMNRRWEEWCAEAEDQS